MKILVDTGSHYSFVSLDLANKLKLQPETIAPEKMETAGGNQRTIRQWVPSAPVTVHTIRDKFTKSVDLRIMPMQQHDILLGWDAILHTFSVQHDLSITTKRGDILQQWETPDAEKVTPISWRQLKKSSKCPTAQIFLATIKNDAATQTEDWEQLEKEFFHCQTCIVSFNSYNRQSIFEPWI